MPAIKIILIVIFLSCGRTAYAQAVALGNACSTAGVTAIAGTTANTVNMLYCDGTVWQLAPIVFGASNLACSAALAGSLRYNAAVNALEVCNGLAWSKSQESTLFRATSNAVITGSAALTAFGTGIGTKTIPAARLKVGTQIRVFTKGTFTTRALAPGNLIVTSTMNGVVVGQVTISNLAVSTANGAFRANALITVRSTGTTGTVVCNGDIGFTISAASFGEVGLSTGAITTINTNNDQTIDVTLQWATSDPGNVAMIQQSSIEVLD